MFRFQFFVVSANDELINLLKILVKSLLILQPQLLGDDVEISNRIDLAFHVGNICIFKSAWIV